jgi:hypothetical protein
MGPFEKLLKKGGPYIGPKGGKWQDPEHKIPWHGRGSGHTPKEGDTLHYPKTLMGARHDRTYTVKKKTKALLGPGHVLHVEEKGRHGTTQHKMGARKWKDLHKDHAEEHEFSRKKGKAYKSLGPFSNALAKATKIAPPPAKDGWKPIKGDKNGGYSRMNGGKREYWYPGKGIMGQPLKDPK